jgi:aryl-alcohol dehydrogenase-like predicted oxidoreductase
MTMERRPLGRSGLEVSVLSLGTLGFGGRGGFATAGRAGVTEATRLVDLAIEAGVNLFDTADVYSHGASEEVLGAALAGRRDEVLIATKVGAPLGPGESGLAAERVVAGCEASLRRLGTDRIDLFQVHRWDGLVPLEETLGALDRLVEEGKVRHVGCSNFAAWQLMKALATSERERLRSFCSQQVYYSLVGREAEYELVPIALDQGVGMLVWSPLAGGFLTGKYTREDPAPAGSRRAEWGDPGTIDADRGYAIVRALQEIAAEHEATVPQAALRWVAEQAGVASVIVGARDERQLADNLGAARWRMSAEELDRLDELSLPPLLYPYWHQQAEPDRLGPADRWPRRAGGADT